MERASVQKMKIYILENGEAEENGSRVNEQISGWTHVKCLDLVCYLKAILLY